MSEALMTLAVFLVLLILGVPVAFSFFTSGVVGIMFFRGFESGLSMAALSVYSQKPPTCFSRAIPCRCHMSLRYASILSTLRILVFS